MEFGITLFGIYFGWITLLGLAAGLFSSGCQVPQVLLVHKSKSTRDLAFWYILFGGVGTSLWFAYGVARFDVVIIFWNSLSILMMGYLLIMKITERKRNVTRQF